MFFYKFLCDRQANFIKEGKQYGIDVICGNSVI